MMENCSSTIFFNHLGKDVPIINAICFNLRLGRSFFTKIFLITCWETYFSPEELRKLLLKMKIYCRQWFSQLAFTNDQNYIEMNRQFGMAKRGAGHWQQGSENTSQFIWVCSGWWRRVYCYNARTKWMQTREISMLSKIIYCNMQKERYFSQKETSF